MGKPIRPPFSASGLIIRRPGAANPSSIPPLEVQEQRFKLGTSTRGPAASEKRLGWGEVSNEGLPCSQKSPAPPLGAGAPRGATSPCGDQHSPNFGMHTQTQKNLGLLGWLGHQGVHTAWKKKQKTKNNMEKMQNQVKNQPGTPDPNGLEQQRWGERKAILKKAAVCC